MLGRMDENLQARRRIGALNLLKNCANCQAGEHLLVVYETGQQKIYDPDLVIEVMAAAGDMGVTTSVLQVPFNPDVTDPCPVLTEQMQAADKTLFLARIGDQIRFRPSSTPGERIISYVYDPEDLASNFGTAHHQAFETLKQLVNHALAHASDIHVTCPQGTNFRGDCKGELPPGDVSVKRFPMSVFTPRCAQHFEGTIAQRGFLIGTGSNYYSPYACGLEETLFVNFKGNRIIDFDGSPRDVEAAKSHYEYVGQKYEIDPYYVHSWHAGIHPGCSFAPNAADDFERWSGTAFGNPRLLHFHTCGAYPPGEISLNIVDPTVTFDGVNVWENGRFHPERLDGGEDILATYPCALRAFQEPAQAIGLGQNGHLSYH